MKLEPVIQSEVSQKEKNKYCILTHIYMEFRKMVPMKSSAGQEKLKSRDITLPTKVHSVKAMVFPVVMYGCESWTIKKAERRRIDAFQLWC